MPSRHQLAELFVSHPTSHVDILTFFNGNLDVSLVHFGRMCLRSTEKREALEDGRKPVYYIINNVQPRPMTNQISRFNMQSLCVVLHCALTDYLSFKDRLCQWYLS